MQKIFIHSAITNTKDKAFTTTKLYDTLQDYDFKVLRDQENKKAKLDSADIFIIEASKPSTRGGYVIAYAIAARKPVLCLYHKKTQKRDLDYLQESVSAKLLQMRQYDEVSIHNVFSSYLRQKKNKEIVTTKFTLRIPPSVVEYLNWKQKNSSHKSKAALIRDGFIDNVMKKDEKYQQYLRKKY